MEFYGIFIMANKRGVLGWTLMRFDGKVYWYPTEKWYSSYRVARKMADRLNLEIKKRRLNESMLSAAL